MGKLLLCTTPTTTIIVLGPDGFAAGEKAKGDKGGKGEGKYVSEVLKPHTGKRDVENFFSPNCRAEKRDMNISN